MRVFKSAARLAVMGTVFLAVLIMAGCATTVKYSYDTRAGFSELKSYKWAPSSAISSKDSLLETNVQALAEQFLEQKGFTKVSEKADLLISMNYENEYSSPYKLRMLTLNVYKSEPNQLIWRGTAYGSICTDAPYKDLNEAMQGILANFPPK
jgi:hypothetical protein